MTRYILPYERTRPYRITRSIALGCWVVWDRRRYVGTALPGMPITPLAHPTHAAAVAALDAHLREQALKEPTA